MSSYIKFLSRNKLYTAIEAIGLTISLAFVVIIFCYVAQQIAVTRENPHRKEIPVFLNETPESVLGNIHQQLLLV